MRSDITMAGVVSSVIERHGGIAGLMRRFEQAGLRPTIHSWLIRGSNRPMTAEQLEHVMGLPFIRELAAQKILAPHSLAIRLAYILPSAIDSLASSGRLTGMEVL